MSGISYVTARLNLHKSKMPRINNEWSCRNFKGEKYAVCCFRNRTSIEYADDAKQELGSLSLHTISPVCGGQHVGSSERLISDRTLCVASGLILGAPLMFCSAWRVGRESER